MQASTTSSSPELPAAARAVIELIAQHDGRWTWYQVARGLGHRGVHLTEPVAETLERLERQGMVVRLAPGPEEDPALALTAEGWKAFSGGSRAPSTATRAGQQPQAKDLESAFDVILLPEGFFSGGPPSDLRMPADALLLHKALKRAGLRCGDQRAMGHSAPEYLERRGGEAWLGTLWVLERSHLVRVAQALLDVLSGGCTEEMKVHIELRLERPDELVKFEGALDSLKRLLGALSSSAGARAV